MKKELSFRTALLPVIMVFFIASCSTLPTETEEERVATRAMMHETALLKNDFKTAYTFMSPGYRAAVNYKNYLGSKGSAVKRESAKIRSVNCETDTCIVEIDLYYRYQGLQGIHTKPEDPSAHRVNQEKWIKIDGQWWLYEKI